MIWNISRRWGSGNYYSASLDIDLHDLHLIMSIYPFLRSDQPHLSDMDLRYGENYFFYKATLEVIKFSSDKEYKDAYYQEGDSSLCRTYFG